MTETSPCLKVTNGHVHTYVKNKVDMRGWLMFDYSSKQTGMQYEFLLCNGWDGWCWSFGEWADTHTRTHTHTHTHIHTHLLLNPSLWIMSEWATAFNTHFNASSLHVLTYLSFTVFSVHLKQTPSVLFYTHKLMQRIINGYTLKKKDL